jgi:RNA polymerase sigma-70 factor, ECF subfamily
MQAGEFTILLQRSTSVDKEALGMLMPVVYGQLRKLAAGLMRNEQPGLTLQPTALIHEAYLQLVRDELPDFQSRAHFLGVAAYIMRELLVQNARRRNAQKRGSGQHVSLEEDDLRPPARQMEDLMAVDQALERLAGQDERAAKVIELKYFGGLTRKEIGAALGLTLAIVKRDLALGEAWLRRALSGESPGA